MCICSSNLPVFIYFFQRCWELNPGPMHAKQCITKLQSWLLMVFCFFKRIKNKYLLCTTGLLQLYYPKNLFNATKSLVFTSPCHPLSMFPDVKISFLGCGKFLPVHPSTFFPSQNCIVVISFSFPMSW